jgi:hypothetical protein
MINATKLQYYTMSHRLRGFADGLDGDAQRPLIQMLLTSARLLEDAWDDYLETLPPDQRIGS